MVGRSAGAGHALVDKLANHRLDTEDLQGISSTLTDKEKPVR